MCQFLASIDWLEVVQTLAALLAIYVAFAALSTWKHQSKAQKQSDYLDKLTDTVHEYIQALAAPIEVLKIIRIGIESHKGIPFSADYGPNTHVIAYIESRGSEYSKKLWEYLSKSDSLVAQINSLVARGQVYDLKNFVDCINSVKMLLWQNQRLQVVASIIGSTNLYWKNPEVMKAIENMLTVDPVDVEVHLQKHNVEYINFVNENYRKIYSGT